MTAETLKLSASEIVKIAAAVGHVMTVGGAVFEDGKVNAMDLGKVPALFSALQDFGNVQWTQAWPQAADLTVDEGAAVVAAFKSALTLPNKTLEMGVEKTLDVVLVVVQAAAKIYEAWTTVNQHMVAA
jgi:hypothetical protein